MVVEPAPGIFQFTVFAAGCDRVQLAGDFTEWHRRAIPMSRQADGWWRVCVPVPPGERTFSYLLDGARWQPDYAACGVQRNPFGGWVSCLWVPSPSIKIVGVVPANSGSRPKFKLATSDSPTRVPGRTAVGPRQTVGRGDRRLRFPELVVGVEHRLH